MPMEAPSIFFFPARPGAAAVKRGARNFIMMQYLAATVVDAITDKHGKALGARASGNSRLSLAAALLCACAAGAAAQEASLPIVPPAEQGGLLSIPETWEPAAAGGFAPLSEPPAAIPVPAEFQQQAAAELPIVSVAQAEFQAPAEAAVEIPAVIERPLGIDEGPLIQVTRFRLLDAADYPEWGVRTAELEALLLEARRAHGAAADGFTVGRLQALTDEVSKYYHERGLVLAYAILPVQRVEDGEIDIQVFEGRLGRVLVEGNSLYQEALLREPFEELLGKPVVNSLIESALLRVTDYPGLAVIGVFQPGQQVGEADLVLKVQEEQRLEASVRLDNQGTRRTGRLRARPAIEWNNLTAAADRLRLVGQKAYDPENQSFWSAEYRRRLGRGYSIGAFVDRNGFDVGGDLEAPQVAGETHNVGVFLDKSFLRSRQRNLSAELRVTRKQSLTTVNSAPISEDKLAVLQLRLDYDSVDIAWGGLNFAYLTLSRGFNDVLGAMGDRASGDQRRRLLREGPSRCRDLDYCAEGKFHKALFGYTRLQTLTQHQSLLLRSELQWSSDLLVPLEQFSMGGPESVRAYGVAELLWDRAAFLSVEYLVDAPFVAERRAFGSRTWGELLQLSLFADYAIGRLNEPLLGEASSYEGYGGAGLGLRLNLPGRLVSRLMTAWSLGGRDAENGRDPQLWFDMTLDF